MADNSVHILGAGIVGLATAAALIDRDYEVTVIDRQQPGSATSRGNAAAIAWTDVAPLASPDLWRKLPGWLLDPLGPLAVRPTYAPSALPWMLRFLASSRPSAIRRSTAAIAALNALALPAWEERWQKIGWGNRIRREGCLEVFDRSADLASARAEWQRQRDHGIEVEELDGDAVRDMEPAFSQSVVGGAYIPGWLHVDDPHELCLALADYIRERGGAITTGVVASVWPDAEGASIRLDDGRTIAAERLVIACGAWSKPLAAGLGDKIPLDTERGYNITVPEPGVSFRRFIMLPGHGFVMSPIQPGLRIGGAVEFAGLKAPPNWKRVDALIAKAMRFAPALKADEGERWMGFRPSIPDSLPVISKASAGKRIFYAFGHAHHGLTQAAATAEMIADMIAGRKTAIDISPFRADRF